ncbi:MAG: hypothetical protein KGI33_11660 [Thaumarchaeota archaeon]|nr:hypothetical protein [Nitrososphaerota archaeon]
MKTLHLAIVAICALISISSTEIVSATEQFPSPLKQFESGIRPQVVECNNDLQLVIQYENLEPLCIDFNKLNTPLERGLLLYLYPPNESSDGLSVEGLNDTYTVGQPINFTVKFSGESLSCSYPRVVLTTDNNILAWSNFGPLMMCDPADTVEQRQLSWPVDVEELHPMKNSGSYNLVIIWNGKTLHKSFWEESAASQVIIPEGFSKHEATFEPQNITVKIGVNETIRWTNEDNSQNTIISDSQDDAGFYERTHFGNPLPSSIDPGNSFTQWFDRPGKYEYHASSGQNGTVTVLPVDPMFEWLQIQHPRRPPLDDHRYSNDMVAVLRGTLVSWDNIDNVTHTITSKYGPAIFDSGPILPGARFTLDTEPFSAGYYDYYDKMNPSLMGGIRVIDPGYYNDSELIAVAKDLNYSKMFLAAHPDAVISIEHNYYDSVYFDVEKQVYPSPTEGTRTLRLEVTFDRDDTGVKSVGLGCLGPVSGYASNSDITKFLQNGWCLTPTN